MAWFDYDSTSKVQLESHGIGVGVVVAFSGTIISLFERRTFHSDSRATDFFLV